MMARLRLLMKVSLKYFKLMPEMAVQNFFSGLDTGKMRYDGTGWRTRATDGNLKLRQDWILYNRGLECRPHTSKKYKRGDSKNGMKPRLDRIELIFNILQNTNEL